MADWPRIFAASGLGASALAALALVITNQAPTTATHEGTRYQAYRDPAGIWTICNGHTRGVTVGMVATRAQCDAWLQEDMAIAGVHVIRSTAPIVEQPAALGQATDFTLNAGAVWWDKSPMRAHFLARRWRQGCEAFRSYIIRAQVRKPIPGYQCAKNSKGVLYCVLPGLVKRRDEERRLCLAGLK